jgi:murein DD-endopeptidase MepM/ murein hydrolase activator NlpD
MSNFTYPLDKFKRGTAFGVVDAQHPHGHRGTDYNGFKAGTPLKALADGKIVLNQWSDALGWVTVLQVGKQFFGYCHQQVQSPLKVGSTVKMGAVIGKAGTTGSASSGVHLHLTLGATKEAVFSGAVQDADKFLHSQIGA